MVDDPPDIITATSTNPDDSEPMYCSDSNSTVSTAQCYYKSLNYIFNMNSLVVSLITPTALLTLPTVIAGLSDDGTINVITNAFIFLSTLISSVTGTLTLLIVIPLSNVAVSGVALKSTPPVSQTLFTQHIIIHIILLPSADTGYCSDGVTVTSNE